MPFGSTSTRRAGPTTPRISDAARSLTPENSTGHAFQLKERSSSLNTSCVRFQTQWEVITVGTPSRWLRKAPPKAKGETTPPWKWATS